MCESCGVKSTAYTRMVMTIREKFADLRCLVSKAKDNRMVLLLGVGVSWNKLRAGDKPTSFFYSL